MHEYRDYDNEKELVRYTYELNHKYQTYDFVNDQLKKYCTNFDKDMTIWTVIEKLNDIVDDSDVDTQLPQIVHGFQAAEAMRHRHPDKDWLHLIALIHDCGKILAHKDHHNLPQWCVVGDTFPVGCAFDPSIVHYEFFCNNDDNKNTIYGSKYGIYKPNCGIDNVLFSFGHDEYMYQVCHKNNCTLPDEALKIIRYHSFYSWHHNNQYEHLMNENDYNIRELCKEFSKCDLYSKTIEIPNIENLKPYYDALIKKYFPDKIYW